MINQNELIAEVKKEIDDFKNDIKTSLPASSLKMLFQNFPLNNQLNQVLIKATAINSLYSTNIYDIVSVAENIVAKNIDGLLKQNDLSVIEKIASGHGKINKKGTEWRFYSFATKYCHFHNMNEFPIYDSYVHSSLKYFKEKGAISFRIADLNKYTYFKEAILKFREINGLEQFSLEEIDHFLWKKGRKLAGIE